MAKRFASFLESLVMAAILLVLVQTFLEDFSVLAEWPLLVRQPVQLAGFFFDLFFTIEFLVRLYYAAVDRRALRYLSRERGWVDFLASVPLLMFSSGPFAAGLLLGRALLPGLAGVLNLLKIIKAIRIARILRLLRIAKLFRNIKNVASPMAQRHVSTVATIGVSVLVLAILFFTSFSGFLRLRGYEASLEERQRMIAAYLEKTRPVPERFTGALRTLRETDDSLLLVKYRSETYFSRYDDGYYSQRFASGEYSYLASGELELFFDLRPYVRQLSRDNLIFLVLVVLIVMAYLFIYGPHFAITVSDPIHVMRRGMEEAGYNLEVKIHEKYREDDVFRLAQLYNERYLPLKDLSQDQKAEGLLSLDADGIQGLLEPKDD